MLNQRSTVTVARLGVAVFVLALLGGLLLPIYSDEIGWRLQERAGIDGLDKMFDALCGAGTALAPPSWMMPVRWYSAFFNTRFADPFFVRLSGVGYALVWTCIAAGIVRRLAMGADRRVLTMFAVGLASLGWFPLLLVMSRPEQPIGLALCAAVLVSLHSGRRHPVRQDQLATAWLRSLAILILGAIALSYHFKALFVVPVLLACLAVASRGRSSAAPKVTCAAALIYLTASAARYWLTRLSCPADAAIASAMSGENLGAALTSARSLGDFVRVIGEMSRHLDVLGYVRVTAPRPDPMGYWMPLRVIGSETAASWAAALAVAWIVPLVIAAVGLIEGLGDAVRERRWDGRWLIAAALGVAICGWMALQRVINVYESAFILPLLLLLVLVGLSGLRAETLSAFRRPLDLAATCVGAAGIVNIAAVVILYGPTLFAQRAERGYLREQPLSVAVFGASGLRADVIKAASACGIGAPAQQHRLLVDDVTYLFYMQSRLPDHVIAEGSKMRSPDHVPYMRQVHSDGAILSCSRLPQDLRDRAVRTGDFCCVPPPEPVPISSPAR